MSGSLPESLGDLSRLEVLSIRDGALTGGGPTAIGKLGSLRVLSLENNALGGAIPIGVVNLVADDLSLKGCTSGYGVPNQTAAFGDYLVIVD